MAGPAVVIGHNVITVGLLVGGTSPRPAALSGAVARSRQRGTVKALVESTNTKRPVIRRGVTELISSRLAVFGGFETEAAIEGVTQSELVS